MNISDFTYLLKEPDSINEDQTEAIESIIKQYPYFQAAHAIFLKGLKNQESFLYNDQLKVTAAHTADRTVLFDFITSDKFKKPIVSSTHNEKDPLQIEVEKFEEIKTEPENIISDTPDDNLLESNTSLEKPVSEDEVLVETPTQAEANITEIPLANSASEAKTDDLEIDKPLEFDKSERYSFNEWLQLSAAKPIDRSEEKTATQEPISDTSELTENTVVESKESASNTPSFEEKLALIDRFIEKNPKIRPSKDSKHTENLAEGNLMNRDELMTETLAKVYLAQKKYKKAIQAYKILSLKYPEKNSFFADRIQEIKRIKKNN